MFDKESDEQIIKKIITIKNTTDDQFLEECFALGTIATGLAQIKGAIDNCNCEKVDLTVMKKDFLTDYKKVVKLMKDGKLEEAYDKIKAYMVAYKAAHLAVLKENDEKIPSILNGPLCGVPSNSKILH